MVKSIRSFPEPQQEQKRPPTADLCSLPSDLRFHASFRLERGG